MAQLSFDLVKTYADCIDNEGNCFIVYWAKLRFYFLKISYSGLIFSDSESRTKEHSSLSKSEYFGIEDVLQINNSRLSIAGSWKRRDPGIAQLLYTDAKKRQLYWNCHHPKAATRIQYKEGLFSGLGYAETLSLQFKPWRLPIDELRWGRFLSEKSTIIWICWKGEHALNKIYLNGVLYEDANHEHQAIVFNNGNCVLKFEQPILIRKGKLSSVLQRMPWLKLMFSSRILRTVEEKLKSRSVFVTSGTVDEGWSLYEIVTWPK